MRVLAGLLLPSSASACCGVVVSGAALLAAASTYHITVLRLRINISMLSQAGVQPLARAWVRAVG
jgi:hypothetical protein